MSFWLYFLVSDGPSKLETFKYLAEKSEGVLDWQSRTECNIEGCLLILLSSVAGVEVAVPEEESGGSAIPMVSSINTMQSAKIERKMTKNGNRSGTGTYLCTFEEPFGELESKATICKLLLDSMLITNVLSGCDSLTV